MSGLPGVGFDELVTFPGDLLGIAFNVDADEIGVVLLGEYWHLHAGDQVERTGRVMDVAVGDGLLGRVIDPLGQPLDGYGPVAVSRRLPIERPAVPIMDRAPVTVPLQTGLKVIDALIPIGRGQRELILGDRQTGKTGIAIDTILNQCDHHVLCVYCAIGQRASAVAKAVATLREKGAMDYTVVVVTEGNDPPGLTYIAPYAATSIAEHFMEAGRDVLIVYDDLTNHARAYRELSLLLRRPPGREAFPGDIFYIHSRLLERATRICARNLAAARSRPAHHRDRSAEHFSLHSDQPDFHHGWADLPLAVAVRIGGAACGRCRANPFPASAARHSGRPTGRWQATSSSPTRSSRNLRPLPGSAPAWMKTLAQSSSMDGVSAPASNSRNSPRCPCPAQIAVLLALTSELFDRVPLDQMTDAEHALREAAADIPAEVLERLDTAEKLSDEDRETIIQIARASLDRFQPKPEPGEKS